MRHNADEKPTTVPKCNSIVTTGCNSYNVLTPALRKFIYKAKRINRKEKRPFSYLDFFPELSHTNFRQRIRRVRPFVEAVITGCPTFYKVKGTKLPGDARRVTFRPTGDGSQLIDILESLKDQPAKIHDIKLQLHSQMHRALVEKGCTIDPTNKSILIKNIPITDNNFRINALVYPKTVQIDVACSFKSLVYDISSLLYLQEMLKEASMYLTTLSGIILPSVKDWIITHYHLNKDGSYAINGRNFHFTMEEVSNGLIRYYSKMMPDGTKIARVEQIKTPHISIFKAMQDAVKVGSESN